MAAVWFYERVAALSRVRHQQLRVRAVPRPFQFAARHSSVLLAGSEFARLQRDFPIVFVGQPGQPLAAMALLGLGEQENLFVDAQGNWLPDVAVPAFLRRYPFVLAGEDDLGEMKVCIDEAWPGFNTEQGEALFDESGAETEYLKNVIEFLRLFHAEMLLTAAFVEKLVEFDLLVPQVVTVRRKGKAQTLEGLMVVDESRLKALDDARSLELLRGGFMGWIHAHLFSLGNLERLVQRQDARLLAAQAASGQTGRAPLMRAHRPRHSDLYVHQGERRSVHFRPGTDCPQSVLKAAGLLFDMERDGLLPDGCFHELKRFLRAVAKTGHDLRVQGDVLSLIAGRRGMPRRSGALERLFPMRRQGVTHY